MSVANCRRLYHHMVHGGQLTIKDVSSIVQTAENLQAENAELREAIKVEQDLRKNWHNEEAARLRTILSYIQQKTSCSIARQWATKALEVNDSVDDDAKE